MITEKQLPELLRQIAGTAEAIGGTLSPNGAAMMASDLRQFELGEVSLALAEVRRVCKGRFGIGDVLRILAQRDTRPHGDEAWAIAVSAGDDRSTVVLTEDIQLAMAAAQPVIDIGDMIGARRTFLMAYERIVGEARMAGRPASWQVSLGTDKSGRVLAIQEAVRLGRLPREEAVKHLRHQVDEPVSGDGHVIAGLITGKPGKPSPKNRTRFAELRQNILAAREAREDDKHQEAVDRQADRDRRLAEHLELIRQLENDDD
ncbi:hypothetical protein D9M68_310840 [compost metagenome]